MAIPAGANREELTAPVTVPYRPNGFFYEIWSNRWIYGMALPGVLFLFMFSYIPLTGIVIAFKDFNVYDGIYGSPWNNFRNFEIFFTSPDVWIVMWNTIYLNFLFILFGTLLQIGLAVMINELAHKSFKKAVQSLQTSQSGGGDQEMDMAPAERKRDLPLTFQAASRIPRIQSSAFLSCEMSLEKPGLLPG